MPYDKYQLSIWMEEMARRTITCRRDSQGHLMNQVHSIEVHWSSPASVGQESGREGGCQE